MITHDLELALEVADSIAVLYAGTTVEEAASEDFITEETLRHPYTRALYRAMPKNGFIAEQGTQPYAGDIERGCPYRSRCPFANEACGGEIPWLSVNSGHVRCVKDIRKAGERR